MRILYLLGGGFLALCTVLLLLPAAPTPVAIVQPVAQTYGGGAGEWFNTIKPFCNSLEVETQIQYRPPPPGAGGTGYAAACFALAGKIGRARELITQLSSGERGHAAGIVFNVGHPVADAGDDQSAGPMMELVLEFWPENYMARYHAGMSAYTLGRPADAERHLRRFLEEYHQNDGWRSNAVTVLARLTGRRPPP